MFKKKYRNCTKPFKIAEKAKGLRLRERHFNLKKQSKGWLTCHMKECIQNFAQRTRLATLLRMLLRKFGLHPPEICKQ